MITREITWVSVDEKLPKRNGQYLVMCERSFIAAIYMTAWFAEQNDSICCLCEDLSQSKNIWYNYDSEYGDVPIRGVKYWAEIPKITEERNR